ncbi:SRPBCC family protein [Undibacterium sp.]|uniref:SRPBCC family protein n=1 Tax=Undibacterium sp. TaxID=1914977 RepID=UPI002B89A11C|nr:SRPBCC family protein [Undibacterium sp.]HTD05457.1 SRPBCC family protein [Undibacterium sp.]
MRILKWLLGIIVALVVLVFAIALLLPNEYTVTRSIVINAPAEKIYPLIASPAEWKKWSVWNQRDPAMQMTFSGPASGAGAAWDWQSKTQGNGGMKFTQATPNQNIDYELHFEGMDRPSSGALKLEPQDGGTKLTWSMQGTSEGNLMMKLFAPFMDKMVGSDFDSGLKNLKKLVEQS